MKLMMLIVLIGLTVDNVSRQNRTRKPRERFGPPRLGRRRLYDRVIRKLLPKQPLPPLTREMVRERSWS